MNTNNSKYIQHLAAAKVHASFFRYEKAIVEFKKAIAIFPDQPQKTSHARLEMTLAYYNGGMYKEAAPFLRIAVEEHPKDLRLVRTLGIALVKIGETKEAEQVLSDLLTKTPDDWQAHAAMGFLWFEKQDYKKSIDEYQKAIDGSRAKKIYAVELALAKARCLEQMDQPEDALVVYKQARDNEPQLWTIYFRMGVIYKKLNDRKNALKSFQKFYDNTDINIKNHRKAAEEIDRPPKEN